MPPAPVNESEWTGKNVCLCGILSISSMSMAVGIKGKNDQRGVVEIQVLRDWKKEMLLGAEVNFVENWLEISLVQTCCICSVSESSRENV